MQSDDLAWCEKVQRHYGASFSNLWYLYLWVLPKNLDPWRCTLPGVHLQAPIADYDANGYGRKPNVTAWGADIVHDATAGMCVAATLSRPYPTLEPPGHPPSSPEHNFNRHTVGVHQL